MRAEEAPRSRLLASTSHLGPTYCLESMAVLASFKSSSLSMFVSLWVRTGGSYARYKTALCEAQALHLMAKRDSPHTASAGSGARSCCSGIAALLACCILHHFRPVFIVRNNSTAVAHATQRCPQQHLQQGQQRCEFVQS